MVDNLRRDVYQTEKQITAITRKSKHNIRCSYRALITLMAILSTYITESSPARSNVALNLPGRWQAVHWRTRLTIKACGEVGDLAATMNTMAENLHNIVTRLNASTAELTVIDRNIKTAARQVVGAAHIPGRGDQRGPPAR